MESAEAYHNEGSLSKPPRVPPSEIFYFKDGRVEGCTRYWNINNRTTGEETYRHYGKKYFCTVFDEHHGICRADEEIPYSKIPRYAREILEARTREGVRKLREQGKLKEFRNIKIILLSSL